MFTKLFTFQSYKIYSLLSGCNVIVEKPPVIKFEDYKKILELEKKN